MAFFEVIETEGKARAGILKLPHREVPTPMFMAVGTQGTVKTLSQQELATKLDAPIILGNTYHLYLRPGTEVLAKAGGLHRFMNWPRNILTDSGGFQIHSLTHLCKITEEGVTFRSHLDGRYIHLSPEDVVHIQRIIGSDIMMALDECTSYPCSYEEAKRAISITHLWAERSRNQFLKSQPHYDYPQYQFGIVQGSVYEDLRESSIQFLCELDFEGYAIGGLAVGEPKEQLYYFTQFCTERLPTHKPRYLMGVGTPEDILNAIEMGVDLFDCVLPTRNARHGLIYSFDGIRNLMNSRYSTDFSPLDPHSNLEEDHYYTKAYVHHLFKAKEILAFRIATLHNLNFFLQLVKKAREHILNHTFTEWKQEILPKITYRWPA